MGAEASRRAGPRAARRAGPARPAPLPPAVPGARLCPPITRGLWAASSLAAASALSSAAAAPLRWARAGAPTRSLPPRGGAPAAVPDEPEQAREPAPDAGARPAPALPAVPARAPLPRAPAPREADAAQEPAWRRCTRALPAMPSTAAPQLRSLGAAWRPVALWWLRTAVLVQVATVLVRSATVGASAAPPGPEAGLGPLLWPVLAAGAGQAAAAAAIAACARVSWWPAVFSALLLVGGAVQGHLLGAVEPLYPLMFGAALVAPGLWVALWAWGWHWPEPAPAEAAQLFQAGS